MDLKYLTPAEGEVLLHPFIKQVRLRFHSWETYGNRLEQEMKARHKRAKSSIYSKLSFRVQFKDLRKSPYSPWQLVNWEKSNDSNSTCQEHKRGWTSLIFDRKKCQAFSEHKRSLMPLLLPQNTSPMRRRWR